MDSFGQLADHNNKNACRDKSSSCKHCGKRFAVTFYAHLKGWPCEECADKLQRGEEVVPCAS